MFQLTLYDASLGERDEVTQNYPLNNLAFSLKERLPEKMMNNKMMMMMMRRWFNLRYKSVAISVHFPEDRVFKFSALCVSQLREATLNKKKCFFCEKKIMVTAPAIMS